MQLKRPFPAPVVLFLALATTAPACGDAGEKEDAASARAGSRVDTAAAEAAMTQGRLLVRQGRLGEAEAAFLESVLHAPENPNGHFLLGKNRFVRNRPGPGTPMDPALLDLAREDLERALALDPTQPRYHHYHGLILAAGGDYPAATASFREALRLHPDHQEARVSLGTALAYQGLLDEACVELLSAIELDPTNVVPHHELGLVYLRLEDWEQAALALEAAVVIEPGALASWTGLVKALTRLGRDAEASAAEENLVRVRGRRERETGLAALPPDVETANPDLAVAFAGGLELMRGSRRGEAIRVFQDVLHTWPDTVQAHINLGYLYLADGRAVEALAELDEAVRVAPEAALGWYHLGRAQAALGYTEQAKVALERSLAIDSDNDGVRLELARVHALAREPEQAATRLREILARNPNNRGVQDFLDSLGMEAGS